MVRRLVIRWFKFFFFYENSDFLILDSSNVQALRSCGSINSVKNIEYMVLLSSLELNRFVSLGYHDNMV